MFGNMTDASLGRSDGGFDWAEIFGPCLFLLGSAAIVVLVVKCMMSRRSQHHGAAGLVAPDGGKNEDGSLKVLILIRFTR